ncbi:hypothetical protein KO507_13310 [Gilvimarinus agarilyticus]|uniref:hypothetical protein n=1 Tax=Gilvimarinus sp. 2_MG-2023 TaxID=3062666 RepID=UPI001C08E7CF|nr:hypothetical protein [Gilvimarinus sp. 2_MG-2023]MBU2886746.1 hypothetical protein [Gilvimarinus agarilyticus]MDO6571411.1 hypothetical protein [Gilvimarinus sp. 2_MG-2023]
MATSLMAFELLCLKSVPMQRVYIFAESLEAANGLAVDAGFSSFLIEPADAVSCLIQANRLIIPSAQ